MQGLKEDGHSVYRDQWMQDVEKEDGERLKQLMEHGDQRTEGKKESEKRYKQLHEHAEPEEP